jgi:poly-gamma-glutamate synthesis protein (capsule biosynthesis protein)
MGVGDVIVGDPPSPSAIFDGVREVLGEADVLFGQAECIYASQGEPVPDAEGLRMIFDPNNLEAIADVGFNVMSVAGNHTVDMGHAAFLESIDNLRAVGIATAGGGSNLDEARRYAVVTRNGVRLAVLAYSPACPQSYFARPHLPGVNPMVIHNHYINPEPAYPGATPRVHTFVDPEHLKNMRDDIAFAKREADVVVVSFHKGRTFEPVTLATYESELCRAAIDAGADLILGHHQHIMKAVEVYRGKAIFHGINHFVVSEDFKGIGGDKNSLAASGTEHGAWAAVDEMERNPFSGDANLSMIVKACVEDGMIRSVRYIPCVLGNKTGAPRVLRPDDPTFEEHLKYVRYITEGVGFTTSFEVDGNEVVVGMTD